VVDVDNACTVAISLTSQLQDSPHHMAGSCGISTMTYFKRAHEVYVNKSLQLSQAGIAHNCRHNQVSRQYMYLSPE